MIGVPSITRFVKFIRLGEAAVRYYLTSTAKSIAVDADGNAVSANYITIRVMKQVGSNSPIENYDGCYFVCYTVKGETEVYFGQDKVMGSFSFSTETINGEDAIRVKLFSTAGDIIDTLDITASKKGDKGDKGDRGAVLRGPQAWADIANGYVFQAGGDNDEWKDVVLYNGNYYSCLKGHTKTASNYPTSTEDTNNGYWKLGDKIELVATKILLATYALVKNLGVEAIDMKDSSGNILFQAKDGNVTCKTGTFENITISGTLKGVSGSFKRLSCVNSKGEEQGSIAFGEDGKMWFTGDMYNQGYNYNKDRGYRFYSSAIWCRNGFGARERNVLLVTGTGGYYYTKGTDKAGTYISFSTKKSSSGDTYYVLDCYGDNGDAAGFPVDTIIFNSDTTRYYSILASATQRIMVVNANDKKEQYICSNGVLVKWNGGELAEVVQLPTNTTFMNPVNTDYIGCGLLVGAFRDNNW